jgi:hypothetical protein
MSEEMKKPDSHRAFLFSEGWHHRLDNFIEQSHFLEQDDESYQSDPNKYLDIGIPFLPIFFVRVATMRADFCACADLVLTSFAGNECHKKLRLD